MIKKLVASFFLGVICLLLVSQNDAWVKQQSVFRIQKIFEQTLGSLFNATADRIDFFTPSCQYINVSCQPVGNSSWSWSAKRLSIQFSWLDLLWSQAINLNVVFEDFQGMSTKKENEVPLFDHIKLIMAGTGSLIPVYVKSISLKPACITLYEEAALKTVFLKWHSESKISAIGMKSNIYCLDGKVSTGDCDYVDNITGTLNVESNNGSGVEILYHGQVKGGCTLFCGPEKKESLYVSGVWNGQSGSLTIKNEDQSMQCIVSDIQRAHEGLVAAINAEAPVEKVFQIVQHNKPITGVARAQGSVTINHSGVPVVEGEIIVDDCAIQDLLRIEKIKTTVRKDGSVWKGFVGIWHANKQKAEGSWHWNDHDKNGHGVALLSENIPVLGVQNLFVDSTKAKISVKKDADGFISGFYNASIIDEALQEYADLAGSFSVHNSQIDTNGTVNANSYEGSISLVHAPYITKFVCVDSAGVKQIDCGLSCNNPETLKGSTTIDGINLFANHFFGYQLDGQGSLDFSMTYSDKVRINTYLSKAVVRIPHLYNVINRFNATIEYDPLSKRCDLHNVQCALDRGKLTSHHAAILFDDAYAISYLHAPLLVHDCLLNLNKDLFALISGRLLYLKKDGAIPHLAGSLILERSQLRENILSQEFQKKIFQGTEGPFNAAKIDMTCALSIETAAPIRVETPFLEANAHAALMITNTVHDPCVTGSLTIGSGTLYFPYKSLHITKGTLFFDPDQPSDPVVELVAKNKIKKYNITLNVTGSLRNHQISLESTPSLTEEQVMALLLIGSHEESLNIVMPALIMSNLKSLIFDGAQSRDSVDLSFRRLFKPFDHIHLVPSFTDQTGRGGLRGAIEIDVTDRLHAVIQKNFSLTEDTRVEVEYLLSDDISVRAIRNERRDVGGEVEMRWKF